MEIKNKTVEHAIMIGKTCLESKGYGGEALRLLFDYGFSIGIEKITGSPYKHNIKK